MTEPKVVLLIFVSGKVVITGSKSTGYCIITSINYSIIIISLFIYLFSMIILLLI